VERGLGRATEALGSVKSMRDDAAGFSNRDATVPIDLQAPLAQLGMFDGIYVVVEDVPAAVRLSAGRYNGDLSWSLGPGELDGLCATLPANKRNAIVLSVRVLIPDPLGYEFASTIARFDVVVSPDNAQTVVASRIEQNYRAHESQSSPLLIPNTDRMDEFQRLAAIRAEYEAEADARLARTWCKWQAEEKERWSAREAELAVRYNATLAAVEARYQRQVIERIAAAEAQWSARRAITEARDRSNSEDASQHCKCAECGRLKRLVVSTFWLLGTWTRAVTSRKSVAAVVIPSLKQRGA